MATGGKDALQDPELWREQQRMYNFLQHYDLLKYYQRLMHMGVTRLSHFKDVTDADLEAVGFSPPERTRLRKKLEENFSTTGKIKKSIMGKKSRFDNPVPDQAYHPLTDPTHQTASLIAREEIKLEKQIGEGAHGSVYEGTWSNAHGSVVVAVKTLYGKDDVQSTFIKEADSMRALRHQHIIRLYGIVLSSPLMLIQELAPLGCLHSFLEKEGHTKTLNLFHTYAIQIADAMKYLEEKRVVHRDLATRNILLDTEKSVKLSDFGMARILDEHSDVYNLSNLQSRIPIAWTALEALTRAKFSTASDVWSFGVTLWEIYSLGAIPWKGLTPIEIRDILTRGERLGRPERCPTEMYQIMQTCWEAKPQDRPTFASLHKRLLRTHPPQVRALQSHTVVEDGDSGCISFKKGDLIYLIDRPKPGWMFGMLQGGKIGYFLADHVTSDINPIGDIKGKLQSGKTKVADLPISGPSQVSHECHWGQDGKKWGNPEEELKGHQQQPRPASRVNSPPFHVVNNSPRHSPIEKKRSAPLNGENGMKPYSAHPDGRVIGNASDTRSSQSGSDACSPTALSPTSPVSPTQRSTPEHNQYITMKRAGLMMSPGRKQRDVEGSDGEGLGTEGEDADDYLLMSPNPAGLFAPHTYQNIVSSGLLPGQFREAMEEVAYVTPRPRAVVEESPYMTPRRQEEVEEVAYATPRSRDELLSIRSDSSTPSMSAENQQLSEENDRLRQHHSASPPSLPGDHPFLDEVTKRSHTLPPPSSRIRSQYSYVTEVANISMTTSSSSQNHSAVNTTVGALHPAEEKKPHDSEGPAKFPTRLRSLGDLDVAMRGEADTRDQLQSLQPTARPRPRPRPRDHNRVVSMPPAESSSKHPHNPPHLSPDHALTLTSTVRNITLNGAHHNILQETIEEESEREPLIPIEAPPVPERTYLSPIHKSGPVSPIHAHPENNILQAEFPDAPPQLCQQALENHGFDVDKAREAIQVQILLGMNIPHTKAEDCKRALKHCQGKIDRAAGWLVERSEELESKRT